MQIHREISYERLLQTIAHIKKICKIKISKKRENNRNATLLSNIETVNDQHPG